jgi:hypothetical protein
MTPNYEIRAAWDADTITVYQAYGPAIADAAVKAQRFVAPFSLTRMTWVKPSFLWMMERCGWATKPDQERVLAVTLPRARFEALLALAVPTSFRLPFTDVAAWQAALKASPVRVQWDPERDLQGHELPHRSLQLGIGQALAPAYASEWIVRLDDVTPLVTRLRELKAKDAWDEVRRGLPVERPYPLPEALAQQLAG